MDLRFEAASLDAVVGFYSLIHLPREEQGVLLKRIWEWLKDGGLLLVNLSVGDSEEMSNGDWLGSGKKMFWSAWDEKGNTEMIKRAGFKVLEGEVISDTEDGREVKFHWLLTSKGGGCRPETIDERGVQWKV
ncbi:uncharacterized protein LY89DRAFT_691776 [Mollisia scopiformis]|uniref:Uncharacterized protein n=1 Tax=Mollisia scopiformis TaxID=149040 RepID=A0A132B4Z3_MOLSC|nr:uncharacterized protein LY89DRAFT_691776 [Mollisia scopiformis]KUJ07313.1 hypothetical protein LY89DRAFT_691776 [Mollisia scopiformis]